MLNKKMGLMIYFVILMILFQWQIGNLFRPIPILSVFLGIMILTLTQWKKGMTLKSLSPFAMKNGLVAGVLSTLLSLLANSTKGSTQMVEAMLPAIYGGLWYTVLRFLVPAEIPSELSSGGVRGIADERERELPSNWNTPAFVQPILVSQGLTTRECHVALKIIQGSSNKEIADQLFISEGTVKKHIQNIYKRCEVTDRQAFLVWFWELAKK